WAKTSSAARFNLASSGLANVKLSELHVDLDALEITTEYGYGYPPLVGALATRLGVPTDCLVTAAGTSSANHLAMSALINPGEEMLIEQPTYEPLLALAHYLNAEVKRFPRRFENDFEILVDDLEKIVTPRTKLIVLTNLHNPTGICTDSNSLAAIGALARSVDARVLVDEVYLETFFSHRPQTAFLQGSEFIVTSSLTKAFGLSGLRCGWIVAERDLAHKMWLLNDLFTPSPVHSGERLSVLALQQIDNLASSAEHRLNSNRALVNNFLESRVDLETVIPHAGTIVFPRVRSGSSDKLCELLREKYETSVVPGRFFEMPAHFRLGIGGDSESLKEALDRLGHALDELEGQKCSTLSNARIQE
ncbi:MAG TPA: pyridoxal phosphate-dependent aminotransferase, partial [Pyrinomonadaceae bacterium]